MKKRKLRKLVKLYLKNEMSKKDIDIHLQSWLSKCKHMQAKQCEKEIRDYCNSLLKTYSKTV